MRNTIMLFLFMMLLGTLSASAQQEPVTGYVTDAADNSELAGATVRIKGKSVGSISDYEGHYSIPAAEGDILIISYVGMGSKEITVKNNRKINVALSPSKEIDEVIVIGYGTARKSDLTGSIGSLNTKEVLKNDPISVNQALQGRIAGVSVFQQDGAPGAAVSIEIRGANSFSSNTEPLFVIDGIPFENPGNPGGGGGRRTNALSFINPQDIESLEVLKDASATAIYGSRGANGVVLVTTKRGKTGEDRIQVGAHFNLSYLTNRVEFLDGSEYATYHNERVRNETLYQGASVYDSPMPGQWDWVKEKGYYVYRPSPQDFKDGYMNGGTDWVDAITQQAFSQEYSLNYSGASEKGDHYVSAAYLNQDGVIYGSGYDRFSLRSNINRKLRDFMRVGTNINFTTSKTQFALGDWKEADVFRDALVFSPTEPINNPITMDPNDFMFYEVSNPYTNVRELRDWTTGKNIQISGFAAFDFLKYFQFKETMGYGYNYSERESYYTRHTRAGKTYNGLGTQSDYWNSNISAESLVSFDAEFNKKHRISAVGVFTLEQFDYGDKGMEGTDFPTDELLMYNMGTAMNLTTKKIWSGRGRSRMESFLGRINYTLNDKYLFTASARADGSSKFMPGNKWADFYSFAFAWRASEETFIKNWNIFSMLKPRFSFGQTGNQSIPNYQSQDLLLLTSAAVGNTVYPGYIQDRWKGPFNPGLLWETTDQVNVGLDMGFFDNKLNFTIDAYRKETENLLQKLLLPPSSGFGNMNINSASVVNRGLEVTVQARILSKTPLKWDIDGNISWNRNEIAGLDADQFTASFSGDTYIQRSGCPIGTIYGYVHDGYYDNEAEYRARPENMGADPKTIQAMMGEEKYKDLDGVPGISAADRTIIGDVNPDYQFGINNNFNWKGFSFSFFIQGSMGKDIINANLYHYYRLQNWGNIPKFVYDDRWTPNRTTEAEFPKPINGYNRVFRFSDRYIEDGSYIRLKNINLGYTFTNPVKFISSIYLYSNASNVLTWTKYRFFDPDVNSYMDATRRGYDQSSYPSSTTVSLGAKVTF